MFKEFDDTDWMGMAGAERFNLPALSLPPLLEPLVNYDVSVDGLDAMAVIDANGLRIECYTPDGELVAAFEPATPELGMRWLALQNLLARTLELTTTDLLAAGFTEEREDPYERESRKAEAYEQRHLGDRA